MFEEILFDLFPCYFRAVLRRNDNRVDADRFAIFVFYGYLRFAIGTKVRQCAVFTNLCQAACQAVCQGNRQWHVFRCFVRSIAEHHALVTGTDRIEFILFPFFGFQCFVYAHGNIRRLFVQGDKDAARIAVKTILCAGVANVADCFADDVRNIDVAGRRNFPYDMYHTGRNEGFARYAGIFVFSQNCVENAVGNLVGHLVGMTFGNGFRCEEFAVFSHLVVPPLSTLYAVSVHVVP